MNRRNLRVLGTLWQLDLRQFSRDKVAAFFSFFFPLMFALLFGIGSLHAKAPAVHVVVVDPTPTTSSRQLERLLRVQAGISIDREVRVLPSATGHSTGLTVRATLVIPHGSGLPGGPPVRVIADSRGAPIVATAVAAAAAELAVGRSAVHPGYRFEVRRPAVAATNQFTFTMPGLIAMALLQLGLFATAGPLIVARQSGGLRHLATTPLSRTVLLAAQVAVRGVIAAVQIAMLVVVASLFGLHVHNPVMFGLMVALGALMFISIGYLIAGLVPGQEAGIGIVLLVNFAMLFLGQIFFDTSGVSWLKPVVAIIPASYLADSMRHLVVGVAGDRPLWLNALVMAAWTVGAIAVARKTFRLDMRTH